MIKLQVVMNGYLEEAISQEEFQQVENEKDSLKDFT